MTSLCRGTLIHRYTHYICSGHWLSLPFALEDKVHCSKYLLRCFQKCTRCLFSERPMRVRARIITLVNLENDDFALQNLWWCGQMWNKLQEGFFLVVEWHRVFERGHRFSSSLKLFWSTIFSGFCSKRTSPQQQLDSDACNSLQCVSLLYNVFLKHLWWQHQICALHKCSAKAVVE